MGLKQYKQHFYVPEALQTSQIKVLFVITNMEDAYSLGIVLTRYIKVDAMKKKCTLY